MAKEKFDYGIYLEFKDIAKIISCLDALVGTLVNKENVGDNLFFEIKNGYVMLYGEDIEQTKMSVDVYSVNPLFIDSADFGRKVSKFLNCIVICDPGISYPNVHPLGDGFLRIDNEKEEIIYVEG